jgi:hypothetical protein
MVSSLAKTSTTLQAWRHPENEDAKVMGFREDMEGVFLWF